MSRAIRALAVIGALSLAALAGSVLAAVFLLSVQSAFATAPLAMNNWDRYTRIPVLDEGHEVAVATSTGRVLNDTGTYTDERDLELIEWETAVSIECEARACFCLSMDDDVTMGSGTTCGDIADPNATLPDTTGGNSCVTVPAGGRVEFIVRRDHWSTYGAISSADPSGYRTGYCSQADGTTGFPCDATDDCLAADGSAGTCTDGAAGVNFSNITGLFIMHEAAAATTCSVRKDR